MPVIQAVDFRLANQKRLQAGRAVSEVPLISVGIPRSRLTVVRKIPREEDVTSYAPYVTVDDKSIKDALHEIAHLCEFLDRRCAAHFPNIIDDQDRRGIEAHRQLKDIRLGIARRQNIRSPQPQQYQFQGEDSFIPTGHDPDVYLGYLGHFCETYLMWRTHPGRVAPFYDQPPCFTIPHGSDVDMIQYLQDAFEAPYWDFIIYEVGKWHARYLDSRGEAALRTMFSVKLELKAALATVKKAIQEMPNGGTALTPLIRGIERRVEVLDSIRHDRMRNLASLEKSILAPAPQLPEVRVRLDAAVSEAPTVDERLEYLLARINSPTRMVIHLNAVFIFILLALAPGYVGFAIAFKSGNKGSTEDADFWFLLQSNIMWTLGSLMLIVPLMRGTWFSMAYWSMWGFLLVGFGCAVGSVALYTEAHTGWSNLLAFFGSISSVAAVLVTTQLVQETGRRREREKPKAE
ncbi:hypothetical protein ACHAQA_000840 [Verticillium albo-atrum]